MLRFWCISTLVILLLYSCESETEKREPIVEILSPQKGDRYFTSDTVPIKLGIISPDCKIHYHVTKVEVDRKGDNITKLGSYDYIWNTSSDDEGYHMINVTVFDDCQQSATVKQQIHLTHCDFPVVYTGGARSVTDFSAIITGMIEPDGECPITETGFYMGDNKYIVDSDSTYFELEITGLREAQYYYYSAYAINAKGESVGEVEDVQTNHKPCVFEISIFPFLTELTDSTFSSYYDVDVIDYCFFHHPDTATGIYYSTTTNPFETGIKLPLEAKGVGKYYFTLSNLIPNTIYYAKAYYRGYGFEAESNEVMLIQPPSK